MAGRSRPGASPARADLTFSVAKTYLALLAGVGAGAGPAARRERAASPARLPGIGFDDSEHNRAVTWTHLLTQTSEWEGTSLRPARHGRPLAQGGAGPATRRAARRAARVRCSAPGSYWEYNDVRINQLALRAAAPRSAGRCPRCFSTQVLRPLGGGDGFAWRRLRRRLDRAAGRRPRAVGAGRHRTGARGVSISARDQARIGQLLLDGGARRRRQLIAERLDRAHERAVRRSRRSTGRLLWLNRDGSAFPGASTRAVVHWSAPAATTSWIDPELDARGRAALARPGLCLADDSAHRQGCAPAGD